MHFVISGGLFGHPVFISYVCTASGVIKAGVTLKDVQDVDPLCTFSFKIQ